MKTIECKAPLILVDWGWGCEDDPQVTLKIENGVEWVSAIMDTDTARELARSLMEYADKAEAPAGCG